ncbi:hypothetical protein B0E49_04245 [Polaromonas sp. C04]|nr:hypothetical protein B0E49_04245 [Polaromonas sp. C04]
MKKRADSWYDSSLCTRLGEDILEDIDTKGIEELRRHRLVWSGWSADETHLKLSAADLGGGAIRLLKLQSPEVLRLFFLSLLWRAAASTRPEFSDIVLLKDELEDLRVRVLNKNPGRPEDYPIQLFQLTTRGTAHNRTPLLERKPLVEDDGSHGEMITYARFYFDGLVSHIHLPRGQQIGDGYLKVCLGFQEATAVFGHEFDHSRTEENLRTMARVVMREQLVVDQPLQPIASIVRGAWPRSLANGGSKPSA